MSGFVGSDRITTCIGTYTRRESFVDGKAERTYIPTRRLHGTESGRGNEGRAFRALRLRLKPRQRRPCDLRGRPGDGEVVAPRA
jgi:hypothetical protein